MHAPMNAQKQPEQEPRVEIANRFRGPPDSGNGGYVCGRLAAFVPGPARVRLRVPPPLGVALEVERSEQRAALLHEGNIIAEAWPSELALDVPEPPAFEEAVAAARAYRGFTSHHYPSCFVCGPEREQSDGLRIFPGALEGRDVVACPWVPDSSLADAQGRVLPEFVWAALDCPGGFAFEEPESASILLGELSVSLLGGVSVSERCVLIGWEIARDGRKHFTGTALFAESGECRGMARGTWLEVPRAQS